MPIRLVEYYLNIASHSFGVTNIYTFRNFPTSELEISSLLWRNVFAEYPSNNCERPLIHLLLVIDQNKSVGSKLFDNKTIKLQPELLIGLVQALMLLGRELGPSKGALREAELGKVQIGILSKDHLCYVVIQDAYDSEPFTQRMLKLVIEKHHSDLMKINFNQKIPNEEALTDSIAEILQTMTFPRDLIPQLELLVNQFDAETGGIFDLIMLSDLDDGIVKIFKQPKLGENIIRILMEILSEIPFERQWLGESKLQSPYLIENTEREYEVWTIYRVGATDFCIMGRAYYNPNTERDLLITKIAKLTRHTESLLTPYLQELEQ